MVCGPWVGLSSRHYITRLGWKTLWLYHTFMPCTRNSRSFTTRLGQNFGFEPQNMPWGDSMPNRPPTQTSWLTLESLCLCDDICAKSLQLFSNYAEVSNALSCYLLDLLHTLFRDLCVGSASLHKCVHPLYVYKLAFDVHRDGEGLINPRLDVHF